MAKPIYKRWWFITVCVLVALGVLGATQGEGETGSVEVPEISTQTQEEPREQEKAEEQAEAKLEPVNEDGSEEHSVLDLDPNTLEALSLAKAEFNCNEDELFYEEIADKSFVVSLGYDAGSGLISTLDSLLIVDGQIMAQMMDENTTYDEYQAMVETVRSGPVEPTEVEPAIVERSAVFDIKWNTKDTDALANGNFQKAVKFYDSLTDADVPSIEWIVDDISQVNNAPWRYYGQMIELEGEIYEMIVYPPGSYESNLFADGEELSEFHIYYEEKDLWVILSVKGRVDAIEGDWIHAVASPVGYIYGINAFGGEVANLLLYGMV